MENNVDLQTERSRKQAELDAQEARDNANELSAQNGGLLAAKRKCESELNAMHVSFRTRTRLNTVEAC